MLYVPSPTTHTPITLGFNHIISEMLRALSGDRNNRNLTLGVETSKTFFLEPCSNSLPHPETHSQGILRNIFTERTADVQEDNEVLGKQSQENTHETRVCDCGLPPSPQVGKVWQTGFVFLKLGLYLKQQQQQQRFMT